MLIDCFERLTGLRTLSSLYDSLPLSEPRVRFADQALRCLKVGCRIEGGGSSALPASGPCVVVANHPFGGLEGLLAIELLSAARDDFKVLGNELLARVPQLSELLLPIDLSGKRAAAVAANGSVLRRALRWLQDGHALIVFPAGEVSHYRGPRAGITDPAWNPAVGALVRHGQADVVPVYFDGANSLAFQLLGFVHPVIRTMMLARELVNKQNRRTRIAVGKPIPNARLQAFDSHEELTDYLRQRTYLLETLLGAERPAERPPHAHREDVAAPGSFPWGSEA